jgi:hypothetical protein
MEDLFAESGRQLGKAQTASDPAEGGLALEPILTNKAMEEVMLAREPHQRWQTHG